ncbi:MAG TPA: ABC transporter substrate-binding protein [Candidatus Scatomonas merdigallinarum]|nr:ABC transporter substrate-binding protein [Candidatus Scatomonas merdigallinarum]
MKLKKILALSLAAAMALSLGACGNKSDSNADSGSNTAAQSDSTGGSGEGGTLKIGGIGPLTGDNAAYGIAVQRGAQIAVDEINAAGGINGMTVEFSMEDDVSDEETAVNAYNALKDWGMQMLLGTVTSAPCIAVVAETADDNMFQLTPSGTAVECLGDAGNAFRVCFSDPSQGTVSADYIAENSLGEKIGVIYNSSDTYSTGIYESFAAEAESLGLNIVAEEAFTADSKSDFSVQLQKCKDAGADLMFLPIYYQEASLILQQADKIGFAPTFFGVDGMDGVLGVENFDTSLAEGVMLLTPFFVNSEEENVKSFVSGYEETYGETPIQFAADAYDGIYAIKLAAEQAGITADMSASDICDAMKTAMTEIELKGVTGTIRWTEDGEPNKEPMVLIIENGQYAEVE